MKKNAAYIAMMISCALLLISNSAVVAAAAGFQCVSCHAAPAEVLPPKHVKKSDFTGCFACHSSDKKGRSLSNKIHATHLVEGKLSEKNCQSCHPVDAGGNMQTNASGKAVIKKADIPDLSSKMGGWLKSDKLAHVHQKKGISCQACHSEYGEDDPYNDRCISCHGNYDALIPRTANTKQARNPHKSHYPTLKCTNCHQSHDAFKDFCKTCHGFGFKWQPKGK